MTGMRSNPEILRLQQLQLMGITSYFPRFALPGALPSESRSWAVADEPALNPGPSELISAELVSVEPMSTKPSAKRQQEPDSFQVPEWRRDDDVVAKEPVIARPAITAQQRVQPSRTAKELSPAENTDDALSLHLLLIPVDKSLCVLNQIPVVAKSELQEKQQKLLDNILFFLGKRSAAYHSVRTFRWPLPGMSGVTSGNAAKSSLMHFLEQFSQEHPFSNLLVMGELIMGDQGASWMREADKKEADTSAPRPWQMLHTYSLDQMLTLPSIKREVWQHLLPLQDRLKQA